MDAAKRAQVRQRARSRCEYRQLPESSSEVSFHVEHIRARQHGGGDDLDNLGLACDRCNLYKGPNLSSVDTETEAVVELFHPRRDLWSEHFRLDGPLIVGITPTGRETVTLLRMNADARVRLRRRLISAFLWR